MKKIIFYILAVISAAALMTGCSEGIRTGGDDLTQESGRTQNEARDREETGTDGAGGQEYLVGPGYDEYLNWTAQDWLAAAPEEQLKAVTAYTVYWGRVTGQKELNLQALEEQDETIEAMLTTLGSALEKESDGRATLKEIAEAAGSGSFSVDEARLGEYGSYLSYTSQDWAAADEAEREKVTLAYALLSCEFAGNPVDAQTLIQSGIDLASYTKILDEVFRELDGTEYTLEEAVREALER